MHNSPNIEFRVDHVHVRLPEGFEFDPSMSPATWGRIKEICQDHDTHRVLVEGYLPDGERSTSEVIEAGQRTAIVPHLWMAFHVENYQATEQSELFETIAASRGIRVKHFDSRERALRWLRANSPK
jgi:hypothetical protein